MSKRTLTFILFILVLVVPFFAKGKVDELEAKNPESFQESIDISTKKKGKYNVLITGKDIAGNEGFYGPFNMYIDPNSDLPVARVSNPAPDSRIIGNVNLVGTCVDDDAVAYVEFKIDGGETVYRAKGKEFWSYFLNTSGFEEGPHTIEAWGVDINGVKGKSFFTTFHLDRKEPETLVKNKGVGELVSGKFTLAGTIEDGNGIERLLYSLDGGKVFTETKIKYDKKTKLYSFKLDINTKTMEEGPNVCWFKAIDKQGSVGIYTFLFFVDNTPPKIEFVFPTDEDVVGSVFSVAGKASDGVGLASLAYKCGKDSGEFELVPGNPFWVKEFDLSKESGKSATVEIIATDLAGNVVSLKKTVAISREKDLPRIEIIEPLDNAEIESSLFVAGCAYDDYGVNEIHYKIDNGKEEVYETPFGGFGILVNDIPAGEHTLKLYPVNVKGIKGKEVQVPFVSKGNPPAIDFETGGKIANVYNDRNSTANIEISSTGGLKSVYYDIDGEGELDSGIKLGTKNYTIKVPVKKGDSPALRTVKVTALDIYDRLVVQTLVVAVSDISGAGYEDGFAWAENATNSSGKITITEETPLFGVYQSVNGASIESVSLTGATGGLKAQVMGNMVQVSAVKDGTYSNVQLSITDSQGSKFVTKPINVFVDIGAPVVKLDMPTEPSFVKNALELKGYVTDGAGVKSVKYLIGANSLPQVLTNNFNQTINLNKVEDGPIVLKVIAEDMLGRVRTEYRMFYKDTQDPQVKMVLPAEGDVVNGTILSAFVSQDTFPLQKAEYKSSTSGSEWRNIEINTLPHLIIGSAQAPISKNMLFRFTDRAGNTVIYNDYKFKIDNDLDIPVVEIHLPEENAVISKDFILSGIVYDDDAPAKIYYKIDNGEYKALKIENSFSVPFALSTFTDNEHTITVYAEDIYGVKSQPISRKIRVSLEPPHAEILTPNINETVKGIVRISGNASDKNGIEKVEISIDNGNTYNLATGAEKWQYDINTHVIDDGIHVVFAKIYDKYGQISVFSSLVNIDNTPPKLSFTYPLEGAKIDQNLFISGHAHDNISLEKVTARIKSLDGRSVPSQFREMQVGTELLVSKEVNIASLPDGKYNLEIVGVDKANNVTEISRNFEIARGKEKNRIEFLYPLNGEYVCGEFNVYARVISDAKVDKASLYIDGKSFDSVEVSKTGYVAFKLNSEVLSEGWHNMAIRASLPGTGGVESNVHKINFTPEGPWVAVDNFAMGDFAIDRPYLKGRAGYAVSDEEIEHIKSKEASKEEKRLFKLKKLKAVEVSFDNGKTFRPAKLSRKGWKYRIETGDLADGNHFLLVRAVMEDKKVAISRTIVKVDKVLPQITLISPGEGGRYNQELKFSGLATDDIELESVQIALRKGDKSTYGVPTFIQGLHFELGFWGASLWNVGFGLSFFDNNVKVQMHYGQFTQKQWQFFSKSDKAMRYGGHIFSLKLLANVFDLPVGFYAGPDWDWLHFTGALGANFSVFTETQSGKPQVLSAILMQLEAPRVRLSKKTKKYFRTFAFFVEGTIWFIPTDVSSKNVNSKDDAIKSIIPHISCGFRIDVF